MAKVVACSLKILLMAIGVLWPCLVACPVRPVSKSRESEIRNKTRREGNCTREAGLADVLAR
jgi:hypothetical protein